MFKSIWVDKQIVDCLHIAVPAVIFVHKDALRSYGFDRSLHILMKDCAIPEVPCILLVLLHNVIAVCPQLMFHKQWCFYVLANPHTNRRETCLAA